MLIRRAEHGEELTLRAVFHSSVHELAGTHYTAAERAAWAPGAFDEQAWVERIRRIKPLVVEESGRILAYADLQACGYIDHFYVAGGSAHRGLGTHLMTHLIGIARREAIPELSADVSLCAEAFFTRHGFTLVERRTVVLSGIRLAHARMRRPASGS